MKNIKINYHNINFDKEVPLPSNHNQIISAIKNILANMSSLNIIKNKDKLEETKSRVVNFSKNKDNFILFGTGGSNLGAKALINILSGNDDIKISFFDNIDPINFKNSINKINIHKTGFIIISKSGSTPETLSQFASMIELFDQKNDLKNFFNNCLVITEDKPSPLQNIAKEKNCTILAHENDIGGRYSIFSNVGMVPAIIAGLDVSQIHEGADDVLSNSESLEYFKLGQFFKYQNINKKINSSVILTYSDSLFYFGKWYLQLWAESIGKNNKGITSIHAVGTTDQHSQLQLYLDGPKDKFFTFITTDHAKKGYALHKKTMKDHNLDYLYNKTMGDLMQAEQQATVDTFKENNFAFREIFVPEINEFSIGQLMALSIMETVASCSYFEVDPFNQPAVEQGKKLTKQYLS